jgi:carbamoyltransferase
MIILGISSQHDAGAALLVDGQVVAAVNEERLNRQKLFWGLPQDSVRSVLKIAGVPPSAIDAVAVSNLFAGDKVRSFAEAAKDPTCRLLDRLDRADLLRYLLGTSMGVAALRLALGKLRVRHPHLSELASLLRDELRVRAPIARLDHHEAHGASAYYSSGWDRCTVVTFDAAGDGHCASVSQGGGGRLRTLRRIPLYHSIASYYAMATNLCGFREGPHEGKVTGLAAFGRPDRALPLFAREIVYDPRCRRPHNRGRWILFELERLRAALAGLPREEIAAGIQAHTEAVAVPFVRDAIRQAGEPRVALAGGLFANVKLNQRIRELPEVTGVWIHPHMGDGGLAVGAALALWARRAPHATPTRWHHAFLGPSWTAPEIEGLLGKTSGVRWRRARDPEREIARLLAEGKVVARCAGRMEYGPRALGNRSILAQATDPTVNDWLNKRLRRTEFMPFAPILLAEDAPHYLKDFDARSAYAAEFMTITYDVTERCRREAPAVVHVDGTARPQLVTQSSNPPVRRILEHYKALTGLAVLINTSFNIHEEPIVCSPQDALRAFRDGRLDALALEDFLVEGAEAG